MIRRIAASVMILILTMGIVGCQKQDSNQSSGQELLEMDWESILEEAKGTTVTFYGYGGDEKTNNWIDSYVAKELKEKYDITLKRVGMNIDDILNNLLNEKNMNVAKGNMDIVWINGENFFTAKENDLLFGPFVDKLPNFKKYVDTASEEVQFDFGYPVEGYEAPFGKAQFVMIYDSSKVDKVPRDHKELLEFVKANPGKFTYPAPPDFTGSAFVRNIICDIVGYEQFMNMKADEEVVRKAIQPAIDYFISLKPYLWNEGKTYPAESGLLDNMFADGEVYMTMSYNPNEASGKINTGEYPATTRTFVFDKGTIGNTHFLAIPFNAPNKAAALVAINFILSPEAQASKYVPEVWGDLPVVDYDKLKDEERSLFDSVKLGEATIPQNILLEHRIPEMPADLVPVIEKIWMENVPGESD